MNSIVYSDTVAVAQRLQDLGVTRDVLMNAVTAAYQASSNCSDLDPKMYRGLTMWAVTNRHLRMALLPEWEARDDGNFSLTVSPDGRIAIAVATGNDGTGIADLVPLTQSSKGPRTAEAVAANREQLGFQFTFPDGQTPQPLCDPANIGTRATWVLLIRQADTTVRAELSLPMSFDTKGRVSGWSERILLPTINFAPLDAIELDDHEIFIDVPVRRRV